MRIITYLKSLEFANSALFWLLLLIPLIVGWYIWKHKKINSSFTISTIAPLSSKGYCSWVLHIPFILRIFTLILLIIALARPQSSYSHKQIDVEGIDIVMTLDISGSMIAEDLKPNRLEAAKAVGNAIAKAALAKGITTVVFDRGGYIYHGRVKALAEGAREGGLVL